MIVVNRTEQHIFLRSNKKTMNGYPDSWVPVRYCIYQLHKRTKKCKTRNWRVFKKFQQMVLLFDNSDHRNTLIV